MVHLVQQVKEYLANPEAFAVAAPAADAAPAAAVAEKQEEKEEEKEESDEDMVRNTHYFYEQSLPGFTNAIIF